MKSTNLAILGAAALFLSAGFAIAGDANEHNINNQNLSKRPYQQSPKEVVENQKEAFDGATLVTEDGAEKPALSNHKKLRINMLGSRPYIEDRR